MSDFSAGSRQEAPLLTLAGHPAGISICYEDAFAEEVAQALPAAAFLVNASNDAWFGDSLAPHQHLEIARMRAKETQRYLLRATNTGISAVIAPSGAILARTGLFEKAVLTAEITPLAGATPYVRLGNAAAVGLALLLVVAGFALARRDRAGDRYPSTE
jgi:apolipoprotein N-acyltransferase